MNRRRVIPILVIIAAATAVMALPVTRHPVLATAARLRGDGGGTAEARASARGGTAAHDTSATDAPRAAQLPVTGVVVEPEPFVLSVHGTGRAEALQRAQLACRVGERVVAVRVREGDRVHAGDALVELDRRPYELALHEAEARLQSTRIDLAALAYDDTRTSQKNRDGRAARTGVTEAEQRVERARLDLEATVLRAPFDGDVVTVSIAVGERAQPDRALVTVVDRRRIRIPAEVLEASFARLSPGAVANVRFPALDGEHLMGRVAALAPELDRVRGTGIAYVELANDSGRIKPGMYCEVEVDAARYDARLAVPRAAVLERSRRLLVFIARHGRAEWSYVETGLENDDRIELRSGVAPGDTVLVDGHLTLAHGAPIRVTLATTATLDRKSTRLNSSHLGISY